MRKVVSHLFHVAQFGTFDVESMGDSLFPAALDFGIGKNDSAEITLFSLKSGKAPFITEVQVHSFEEFDELQSEKKFDLVVLGGGEFLHFEEINFTVDGVKKVYPEGYIWKNALQLAQKYKIPSVLNCVGVGRDLFPYQEQQLREYLGTAACISVRDPFSAERMNRAGIKNAECVADNLWYLNRMYSKQQLDTHRNELQLSTGICFSEPYIIVQYGTTKNTKELARQLLQIQNCTGYLIYLMPMNYCHEDRIALEMVQAAAGEKVRLLDPDFYPVDMLSIISGSRFFIGTSLHGNLTAASYNVPFVGLDMYPSFVSKMDGIFSMLECEKYLVPDVCALYSAFVSRWKDSECTDMVNEKISEFQITLDRHFQRISEIMRGE